MRFTGFFWHFLGQRETRTIVYDSSHGSRVVGAINRKQKKSRPTNTREKLSTELPPSCCLLPKRLAHAFWTFKLVINFNAKKVKSWRIGTLFIFVAPLFFHKPFFSAEKQQTRFCYPIKKEFRVVYYTSAVYVCLLEAMQLFCWFSRVSMKHKKRRRLQEVLEELFFTQKKRERHASNTQLGCSWNNNKKSWKNVWHKEVDTKKAPVLPTFGEFLSSLPGRGNGHRMEVDNFSFFPRKSASHCRIKESNTIRRRCGRLRFLQQWKKFVVVFLNRVNKTFCQRKCPSQNQTTTTTTYCFCTFLCGTAAF